MSTEHQQYSPENQLEVIRQYAATHQMEIVREFLLGDIATAKKNVVHTFDTRAFTARALWKCISTKRLSDRWMKRSRLPERLALSIPGIQRGG
jgi:hypothetical protein